MPEPVDGTHRRHALLVELGIRGLRIVRLADLSGEDDGGALRRPGGVAGTVSQPGQLTGLAAVGGQDPQLWLAGAAGTFLLGVGFDLRARTSAQLLWPTVGP